MASDRLLQLVTVNFDPANLAKQLTGEQAVTVSGAQVGDFVAVNKPTCSAGLGIASCRVSALNTVQICFVNCTGAGGAGVNPAAENYLFLLRRP